MNAKQLSYIIETLEGFKMYPVTDEAIKDTIKGILALE